MRALDEGHLLMKAITLWQPWATWVALGWKPIETHTHPRFASLVGQRIAIHAGQKWDESALGLARAWLGAWQISATERFRAIRGVVLCTAAVVRHDVLLPMHSKRALIDCGATKRWGLFLSDVRILDEPFLASGRQGIWPVRFPTGERRARRPGRMDPPEAEMRRRSDDCTG